MIGDRVSEAIICEKIKPLFEELGAKAPNTRAGHVKEFFFWVTKGWFTGFRERTGLECCKAASGDMNAAEHRRNLRK
jgi:hypothetical protein